MWDAESLDGVGTIVNALLAVGVTLTIAFVTYKLGKRGANKV